MPDFLLELRSEEIPARMQAGARASLGKLFREHMAAAGVAIGELSTFSTPRRLALIARGLPEATEPVREELKGPRANAPAQALDGFLRKTGLAREQLTERDGVLYAVTEKPGRATRDVLAAAIPAIVAAFPWPKSMRWGEASRSTASPRWVRPLSGIVAILGEELVACEVGGVRSAYATLGHRFHHPGEITIGGAHDYADKLRACHVLVDHAEREALIRDKARAAAAAEGLVLVEDEGLVIENAGLTEWPVPLLGRFDAAFLEVPPEVIQLTARTNQKYFVCFQSSPERGGGSREAADGGGSPQSRRPADSPLHHQTASGGPPPRSGEDLADAFVCTANIEAADHGAAIVAGNRKVLAARLSDARFFWEQDRKKTLVQHAEGLARITFHEKLGTVADKVERVAKLARWLVEEGIVKSSPERGGGPSASADGGGGAPAGAASAPTRAPSVTPPGGDAPPPRSGEDLAGRVQLANWAEQAALLCKADLVTEMVGEFPELQGLIGGYYARAWGLDEQVADAIRDHYKPVGQGDEVPTAPVTVAVSLADKLDTLCSFYCISEKPTGSKDPYALRRAAISIIQIILIVGTSVSLTRLLLSSTFQWYKQESERIGQQVFSDVYFGLELAQGASPDLDEVESLASSRMPDQTGIRQRAYGAVRSLLDFFADRLKVQQREAGVRHDLIDAVFALGGEDDLVRLLARVHALQAFVGGDDGANLLTAYKRAANILKKEGYETGVVTPAEAGAHLPTPRPDAAPEMGPRLRENDEALEAKARIPRTGEEDPLAMVDDPDLAAAVSARMAMIHAEEDAAGTRVSTAPDANGIGAPRIPRTGEEDPLALVDDPDLAAAVQARAAMIEANSLSYIPEPAEQAVIDSLALAGPKAAAAVRAEDFAAAMAALASLRAPIDRFFDEVTVNDSDPDKRAARLALLARFRNAVHEVADFSKIEG